MVKTDSEATVRMLCSSVSEGFQGSIFVWGRSGSTDFPTTDGAICRYWQTRSDSTLAELRAYDSRIQFATFVGGSRRQNAHWYSKEATGVLASPSGDVYVTGCTLDNRSRFGLASPRGDPVGQERQSGAISTRSSKAACSCESSRLWSPTRFPRPAPSHQLGGRTGRSSSLPEAGWRVRQPLL